MHTVNIIIKSAYFRHRLRPPAAAVVVVLRQRQADLQQQLRHLLALERGNQQRLRENLEETMKKHRKT